MSRAGLLGLMALLEGGAGLVLLLQPGLARNLLLGSALPLVSDAGLRLAGFFLLGLGAMCLAGDLRHGWRQPFAIMLAYNLLGAAGLTAILLFGETAGPLLGPAALLHAVLAAVQMRVLRSG